LASLYPLKKNESTSNPTRTKPKQDLEFSLVESFQVFIDEEFRNKEKKLRESVISGDEKNQLDTKHAMESHSDRYQQRDINIKEEPILETPDSQDHSPVTHELPLREETISIPIVISVPEDEIIEESADFNIYEDPEGTTDKCTEPPTPQKISPAGKDYTLLDNQENKPPSGISSFPRTASSDNNVESQRVFRPLYSSSMDETERNIC